MPLPLLTDSTRLTGTVLVVDDDEGVRSVLARWIEALGHRVRVASSADEALAVLAASRIDVTLCDVRMPGHDGIWLMGRMCRDFPGTAIVMAAGLTELDPAVTLRPSVVGCVVKPLNRHEVDDVIQQGFAFSQRYVAA